MALWTAIRFPHEIPQLYIRSSCTKDLRSNVNYPRGHLAVEVLEVPVVQVNVWSGISVENKKKIVEGITKVLEDIGVPREAVTIIICEEPKENWASGGKLHSEKFANLGPKP
jgi:4-oxalocrotonate tautomerase